MTTCDGGIKAHANSYILVFQTWTILFLFRFCFISFWMPCSLVPLLFPFLLKLLKKSEFVSIIADLVILLQLCAFYQACLVVWVVFFEVLDWIEDLNRKLIQSCSAYHSLLGNLNLMLKVFWIWRSSRMSCRFDKFNIFIHLQ